MNVSLTPELKKFVDKQVDTGLYQTAGEVVRAGLRRLREEQAQAVGASEAVNLERQLLKAVTELDSGKGVDGRVVLRRLRKRMKYPRAGA